MSYVPDAAPQRGWFGRNWLWFVPLMLLLLLLVVCGGCVAMVTIYGGDLFKGVLLAVPQVDQSLTALRNDEHVREALGEPIELDGFEMNASTGTGSASTFVYRVRGPKGGAKVESEWDSSDPPQMTRLLVTPDGGDPIEVISHSDPSEEEPDTSSGEMESGETESGETEPEASGDAASTEAADAETPQR